MTNVDARITIPAIPKCDRCHKVCRVLGHTTTANFGPIACCWRCVDALSDDSFITPTELKAMVWSQGVTNG